MYLRQNSHSHKRPSGTCAYSSGYGAWYQVSMSYMPNRILLIFSGRPLPIGAAGTGVEGMLGTGPMDADCWSSTRSRNGRAEPEGTGVPAPDGVTGRFALLDDLDGPGVECRDGAGVDAADACGSHIGGGGPPSRVSAALRLFSKRALSASVIVVLSVSASSPSITPPNGTCSSGSSSTSRSRRLALGTRSLRTKGAGDAGSAVFLGLPRFLGTSAGILLLAFSRSLGVGASIGAGLCEMLVVRGLRGRGVGSEPVTSARPLPLPLPLCGAICVGVFFTSLRPDFASFFWIPLQPSQYQLSFGGLSSGL